MTQQQVFSDRYELVRHIARGGMAQVYLATDILLDRPVALKVLFPELSIDPSFVQRFRAEAKAAANLSHPNIVAVYDWGQGERTYFIVMEYVDGPTLSQTIRQSPLEPVHAARVGADVAAALEFAHRRGVIHRDVKPGNVLTDTTGRVKVADFGIARAVGAAEGLTQTGAVMGTATYFSPEQAQGLTVDARSDVYSLGVVLYEMVAGRAPFSGDNPVAIAYKHVREEPVPLAEITPGVPRPYAAVVRKAMAKDPADRYASAGDLRADLQRFADGQAVGAADVPTTVASAAGASATRVQRPVAGTRVVAAAVPVAPLEPVSEERSRTRLFVGLLVALLVVLAALLFFLGRQVGLFGATPTRTIPGDLVGKQYAAAQSELAALGFTRVSQTSSTSDTRQVGEVISSSPVGGAHASTTAAVTLDVSTGPTAVSVPDVTSQAADAATAALRAQGFVVTTGPMQNSSTVGAGMVISTSPAAGASAAKGSTVQLTVSAGRAQVQIPTVAGQTSSTASNKLGQLMLGVVTRNETSTRYGAGLVTRSDPPAGSAVAVNSTVTLYVSSGTAVPNVVGLSQTAANQALGSVGLKSASSSQAVSDPALAGQVISQSPSAGSAVTPGSTVNLVIGFAAAPTTTTPAPTPSTTATTGSTTTTTQGGN